ncbi:uncharacterized protein YwqG [Nonlabens xylanidelens]|uniref:Uncharacterized protein YwqG n=2 Tax=Nonlabens xylanidelens TaxID=191564 RepID=A0A2S6IKT0_9FLAO|nr:YwqG family protein [Nonlabens xylanidelens]PPK94844.1 uncharacterized protein YwqG [Nonlabens xylanidelens]
MGIFDLFKKKKKNELSIQNQLEKAHTLSIGEEDFDFEDFEEHHKHHFKEYEIKCVQIKTSVSSKDLSIDPLGLKDSKIMGIPFWPQGKEYPKDESSNEMFLMCQINFEEVPHLEPFPKKGILQLFFSKDNWYSEDVKVIFHKGATLSMPSEINFPFLTPEIYDESPSQYLLKIDFEKAIDKGSWEDVNFKKIESHFNIPEQQEDQFEEYMWDMHGGGGSKISGYGNFTQGDPRDYQTDKTNHIHLLQLDSNTKHMMFGDVGVAHLFIDKEHLKNGDLEKAWFYWDCC